MQKLSSAGCEQSNAITMYPSHHVGWLEQSWCCWRHFALHLWHFTGQMQHANVTSTAICRSWRAIHFMSCHVLNTGIIKLQPAYFKAISLILLSFIHFNEGQGLFSPVGQNHSGCICQPPKVLLVKLGLNI